MLRQFARNSHKRVRIIIPPNTTGGGNFADGQAFTSSRQDLTPHYSWWNSKYTDFYYGWTMDLRDWAAKHRDSEMSGNAGAFLTGSMNTTGKHQQYALLWSTGISGTNSGSLDNGISTNMATWYNDPTKNTTGASLEAAYLHYLSGSIKYKTLKYPTNIAIGAPAVVTLSAHGYPNGRLVNCSLFTPSGAPSGNYIITLIDANTFSIPATCSVAKVNTGQCSDQFGDGTVTLGNRLIRNQIPSGQKTTTWADEWMFNLNTSASHQYHIARSLEMTSGLQTGIFWDETDAQEPGQGYPCVEYPIPGGHIFGVTASLDYGRYIGQIRTLLSEISGALALTGKECWVNPAGYFHFTDEISFVNAAGHGHLEQTLRTDETNMTNNMNSYQQILNQPNKPGIEMVALLAWTDGFNGITSSGSSGAYSTMELRGKASEWIIAFLCYPSDQGQRAKCYTNTNNYWNYPTTTDWMPMWERDIGLPIVPTFTSNIANRINAPRTDATTFWLYDTSSLDGNGIKAQVHARETDKALVLYRHCPASADNTYGATRIASQSRNEQDTLITLPTNFHYSVLHESGSYGSTVTTVTLRGGEGVILMKTSTFIP